jgi:hypothetical protein
MTYHLRRLRLHALIARIPKFHRYRVTDNGWRTILFCTRCYNRLLRPGLAEIITDAPAVGTTLCSRFEELDNAIAAWIAEQKLVA